MMLYYGITIPVQYDNINWSKDFIQWLHKQRWSYPPATEALKSRLAEYSFLRKEYLHICNELRAYARKQYRKEYYLLRSFPGVGPFIAIAVLAEVGDIKRFKGIDRLNSYVGLVPSMHCSGEKNYTWHYISKQEFVEKLSNRRRLDCCQKRSGINAVLSRQKRM